MLSGAGLALLRLAVSALTGAARHTIGVVPSRTHVAEVLGEADREIVLALGKVGANEGDVELDGTADLLDGAFPHEISGVAGALDEVADADPCGDGDAVDLLAVLVRGG